MTVKAAKSILPDYPKLVIKAKSAAMWQPTWFEKQIVKQKQVEEQQEAPHGKRKKTTEPAKQTKPKQDQSNVHKQQATKVLSEAAVTTDEKRLAVLEQSVAALQETNVALMTAMSAMKDNQHRDQVKMIGLQMELEATGRKVDTTINDIRKCKSAIATVENKLASLSTAKRN
jgi:DNA repair exonuclease SbcCD ATPase subunit